MAKASRKNKQKPKHKKQKRNTYKKRKHQHKANRKHHKMVKKGGAGDFVSACDLPGGSCPKITNAGASLHNMIKAGIKQTSAQNKMQIAANKMARGGAKKVIVPQPPAGSSGGIAAGQHTSGQNYKTSLSTSLKQTANAVYDKQAASLNIDPPCNPFNGPCGTKGGSKNQKKKTHKNKKKHKKNKRKTSKLGKGGMRSPRKLYSRERIIDEKLRKQRIKKARAKAKTTANLPFAVATPVPQVAEVSTLPFAPPLPGGGNKKKKRKTKSKHKKYRK